MSGQVVALPVNSGRRLSLNEAIVRSTSIARRHASESGYRTLFGAMILVGDGNTGAVLEPEDIMLAVGIPGRAIRHIGRFNDVATLLCGREVPIEDDAMMVMWRIDPGFGMREALHSHFHCAIAFDPNGNDPMRPCSWNELPEKHIGPPSPAFRDYDGVARLMEV